MTNHEDLVFTQMFAQVFGQLDAILRHSPDRNGRRIRMSAPSQRPAGASLVPLNYRELFFPRSKRHERPRIGYIARTAMHEQQHRIIAIKPANCDPLLDAPDDDVLSLIDAFWGRDGKLLGVACPQKGSQILEFAIFGIDRSRLRRTCSSLPESSGHKTQCEKTCPWCSHRRLTPD